MAERTPQGYRIRGWWRDRTFLDDLWAATGRHPDKTAVVTHRGESGHCTSLSYAELARLADRCAPALIELDMEPGDVLAVQLSNRWELEAMLAVSRARVLITMTESGGYPLGELGMELAGQLPALEHVLIADGPAPEGADGPAPEGADGPAPGEPTDRPPRASRASSSGLHGRSARTSLRGTNSVPTTRS
jgi:cyclohexanecarboxylate-CoA ligase